MSTIKPKPPPVPERVYNFASSPSVTSYNIKLEDLLLAHPQIKGYCTGALIFSPATPSSPSTSRKILLLQRASHDSFPLKWEIPGGAVDSSDLSILHGLVREVWEEAGLAVASVEGLVAAEDLGSEQLDGVEGRGFRGRNGELWWKVEFVCAVGEGDGRVNMDENEHVDFCWASEKEVRGGMVVREGKEVKISFTSQDQVEVILRGFKMVKGLEK